MCPVQPFLESRVLRKIVQSFCNDPQSDFTKWAKNPLVLRMLKQAKAALDEGRMTVSSSWAGLDPSPASEPEVELYLQP